MGNTKRWYHSKTLYVNILAVSVLIIEANTSQVISPEVQVSILGVINLILRLVTNTGLTK